LQVMHASYSVSEGTQLFWGELDRPHPIPSSLACKRTSKRGFPGEGQVFSCGCALDSPLFFRLTNPSGSEPPEAELLLPSACAMLHRARPARLAWIGTELWVRGVAWESEGPRGGAAVVRHYWTPLHASDTTQKI
jgi:hypothetical protein